MTGSSPDVGSSYIRRVGLVIRERASPTRFFIPPEMLAGNRSLAGIRSSQRSFSITRVCISFSSANMGLLFQSGALINWLSVYENVALPLKELQLADENEIHTRVIEKLRWLDLIPAKDLFPANISGGMKKRVGLARSLITNPTLLMYDEPTSGLDPVMSQVINELVVRLKNELGVTQIVVTHDMNSAYYIADRITFLYKGQVLYVGSPDDIKNSDNPIIQQFITGKTEGPMQIDAQDISKK